MGAASAIRTWNLAGTKVGQFWGVSYAMAALSRVTGLSDRSALLVICWGSSFVSVLLAWRLWGEWVAGFFAILNFEWLQRSFLGGAEPLFMALLLASLLAMRRERWIVASVFGALSALVRPVGVFVLLSLGLILLVRHKYRQFAACTTLGAAIGFFYLLPFWIYFHDPLYQLHAYQKADLRSESVLTIPFVPILRSFIHDRVPWTNLILTAGWILFILIGLTLLLGKERRPELLEHPAEFLFALLYAVFLFTFNSTWVKADFVRYCIPVFPFALIGLRPWIPRWQVLLFAAGALCTVLAAFSAIGVRNVLPMLR